MSRWLLAAVLLLGGCALARDAVSSEPPAVTVTADGVAHELEPWSYCWRGLASGVCADGMPPDEPVDVGSPDRVVVDFPHDDWSFAPTFTEVGPDCRRERPGTARAPDAEVAGDTAPGGGTRLVVEPVGPAGVHDVTLFGRGDRGDVSVTFRWTTPTDGPFPRPEAWLAVLAEHDGEVDSYGVELALSHLAEIPPDAAAEVTVVAATGDEVVLEPSLEDVGCAPGTAVWRGPDADGRRAAALGGETFTYEVAATLDGTVHRAEATWPDDVVEDAAPAVPLSFDPPLPGEG